jgi:hypothetical protein
LGGSVTVEKLALLSVRQRPVYVLSVWWPRAADEAAVLNTLSPAGCTMRRFGKRIHHACVNVAGEHFMAA